MRVIGGEQQLCPCYEEYQEFQKLAGLKDFGLVIYCHRTRTEDIRQGEPVESAENTSRDVFIVHNKKGVKITTSQLTSELEKKNISCPRCRKTFEHAQELMQEVKLIERKIVIGICDHCRKKGQTIKNQFCACDESVKKFKSIVYEQKEDIKKQVTIWLSKMRHLLKESITLNEPKQIKHRAYSDLQINRDLNSPAPRHEPEMQQMFHLETHKSDINLNRQMRETNLKEDCLKQGVAFSLPIKSVPTSFAHTSHEHEKINTIISRTSLLDPDTTFIDTSEDVKKLPRTSFKDSNLGEIFEDRLSMEAKESLKRRHDHSLRQMIRLEKDSRFLFPVLKRPNVYETPKNAPWEQKEPTPKYHVESEMDLDLGPRGTRDLDYPSKKLVKYGTSRISQKNFRDFYFENNKKKLKQRYVDKFSHKTKKLNPPVGKSKSWYMKASKPKESGLKPQFSFFFPKEMEKEEKQIQLDVSSSQLIKNTQEKLHRQAEKKRHEEETQQKLEHDQKIIARKEKKMQAEEKKRRAFEDQKKYEEEQEILTKHKKYNKNDLRSLPVDEDEKQDKVKRFKEDTFEKDGEIFLESQLKGKISKETGFTKKDSKSEPENRNKIDNHFEKAKKGTKSKPEQKDNIDEQFQKAKKGVKSTPEQEDKLDKLFQKAKKDLKSKPEPEQRNEIDNVLDTTKKVVKGKSELKDKGDDEVMKSGKIDLNKKPKQKSKDDDLISKVMKTYEASVTEKAKKDVKEKSEQKKKVKEKNQKIKTDEGERDDKLGREVEALKKQTAKERELLSKDVDAPPKKRKSTKNNNEEISANEKEIVEVKQEKEKKMKTEENERDEKLQKEKEEKERLYQIQHLRKEREALKKHGEKDQLPKAKNTKSTKNNNEEISANEKEIVEVKQEKEILKKHAEKYQLSKNKGAPSETGQSTKIKQGSFGEIKVSLSAILKKNTKEKTDKSANKIEVVVGVKQEISEKRQEDIKEKKEIKDKTLKQESDFKKLQLEHLKEKARQKQKQLEYELSKKKERVKTEQAGHKAEPVDLKIGDVKFENLSEGELILRLIQIKQATLMKFTDIKPIHDHKCHHGISLSIFCPLCYNSELEVEVISLDNEINIPTESLKDIIIGEKILNIKRLLEKTKEPEAVLNVYQNFLFDSPKVIIHKEEPAPKQSKTLTKNNAQGVSKYRIS